MTLPTGSSWSAVGQALRVPYEAPQGRRINVIGAYFSHGCEAGRFEFASFASVPKTTAKVQRKTPQEIAAANEVEPEDAGLIDRERLMAFIWHEAGRALVSVVD